MLAISKFGVFGLGPLLSRTVLERLLSDRESDRPLAKRTAGKVSLSGLRIKSPEKIHGVQYLPTPVRSFQSIMNDLPVDPHTRAFMDYGCGKGRILLLAAEHGFREVHGVDFSKELCEAARDNVAMFSGSAPISVKCADASATDPPAGSCVLYLFNPFREPIVEAVLRRIERSLRQHPREMFVVYRNPQWKRVFDASPYFERYSQRFLWTPSWYVIYRSRS